MSRSIVDRPMYITMKYMYVFLVTNLIFILCNALFFIVYFLADFTFENILLFYISLIPMGPSITAVLTSMGRLVREREISPAAEYWKAYKRSFRTSMKYWFIQLTLITILIIDFHYATNYVNMLSPLFLIFLLFCFMVMMYAFPIIARFEVKIKNLFVVSIYSNFKFFKTTFLNATSIISFGVIFYYFPSISSLFSISLIGFFIMYNLQRTFKHMETEMSENK